LKSLALTGMKVRHTVGKLVPYSDTGRYPGDGKAGMMGIRVDFESTNSETVGLEPRVVQFRSKIHAFKE
jgi:hypothetical protein